MELRRLRAAFEIFVFRRLYGYLVGRSARQILQGRLLDPAEPGRGRWLRPDVAAMLKATWRRVEVLDPATALQDIPTTGNRNNVYLAMVTTAAYQVLLEGGQSRQRAADLVADVGWKVYALGIGLASLPFRLTSRDPGKRIVRTIGVLQKFPFSAPGRPGYEVETVEMNDRLVTNWTWCPPQAYVRSLIKREGDRAELEAFYRSWCLYDWPGADLMADDGARGHYSRRFTLSKGDSVCDMCWHYRAKNS